MRNRGSNERLIFYLKERRESVSYTCVQTADLIGSRLLPDASYGVAFTLTMKLFTMVVMLALDKTMQDH